VGCDTTGDELGGRLAIATRAAVPLVKLVIWAVALDSGTSGGIGAPILMMGAARGGLAAPLLPGGSEPVWAVLGMAAMAEDHAHGRRPQEERHRERGLRLRSLTGAGRRGRPGSSPLPPGLAGLAPAEAPVIQPLGMMWEPLHARGELAFVLLLV
jgi:hypothetical protein